MSVHPPRKVHGEHPDLVARGAWAKMKRGVSLKDCAWHVALSPSELDRIIWAWRARAVRQVTPDEQREQALALRRFA